MKTNMSNCVMANDFRLLGDMDSEIGREYSILRLLDRTHT